MHQATYLIILKDDKMYIQDQNSTNQHQVHQIFATNSSETNILSFQCKDGFVISLGYTP